LQQWLLQPAKAKPETENVKAYEEKGEMATPRLEEYCSGKSIGIKKIREIRGAELLSLPAHGRFGNKRCPKKQHRSRTVTHAQNESGPPSAQLKG